jgi:hypothetical protein
MTMNAPSTKAREAEARVLGILVAGLVQREREERQYACDRNSAVLCLWPLAALGAEQEPVPRG